MRVLIACEFSAIVRDAFLEEGHDAWSNDLLPSEGRGRRHIQGDVFDAIGLGVGWDLLIAFPPCTYLAVSGARWFKGRERQQGAAIRFVKRLAAANVPKIAIENPIGVLSTRWRKPDQIVQPWMFGHGEVKATCFWLKGLPPLDATKVVSGRTPRVHFASPGPDRWKNRSRTLSGIARAMAQQWGGYVHPKGRMR